MREIKFRGAYIENNTWVYGFLDIYPDRKLDIFTIRDNYNEHCITIVVPKSVGQFTGLKDKNGKDIYEGDIVKHLTFRSCWEEPGEDMIVIGSEDCPFISCGWIAEEDTSDDYARGNTNEIIGNIYENPELLE